MTENKPIIHLLLFFASDWLILCHMIICWILVHSVFTCILRFSLTKYKYLPLLETFNLSIHQLFYIFFCLFLNFC